MFVLKTGIGCQLYVCVCTRILKFAFPALYLNRAEFAAALLLPLLAAGQSEPGQDSAH